MAEVPEIGCREPTLLADVRKIAGRLAMVMVGFLVVALANSIWAAWFRADALVLFGVEKPLLCMFDCESVWWPSAYAFAPGSAGPYEAFICVGVVLWLTGYAIRRVAKLMSPGRPA
jgi:hypothetical protein